MKNNLGSKILIERLRLDEAKKIMGGSVQNPGGTSGGPQSGPAQQTCWCICCCEPDPGGTYGCSDFNTCSCVCAPPIP